MKKSVDIMGLEVISISEGNELGIVKGLVVNAAEGSVAALIVDDGKWYLGAKLLPFTAIAGIGEYAVTVESATDVVTVATAPEYEKLLVADIQIIDTKIITKNGRILGKIKEFNIDETGKIISCDIEDTNGGEVSLAAERVITFGKQVTVILDTDAEVPAKPVVQEAPAVVAAPEPVVQAAPAVKAAPEPVVAAAPEKEKAAEESDKKFDDRHRKFLLGKKSSRRIETDNGIVIVDQGGEITEEVLQKAKLAGKFVELSMNIQ